MTVFGLAIDQVASNETSTTGDDVFHDPGGFRVSKTMIRQKASHAVPYVCFQLGVVALRLGELSGPLSNDRKRVFYPERRTEQLKKGALCTEVADHFA